MSGKELNSDNIFQENDGFGSLLSRNDAAPSDSDDRMFEITGSSMLLHNLVECINPTSLMELLASITNAKIEMGSEARGKTVRMTSNDGEVVFSNVDDLADWTNTEPDESLLIEAAYRFTFPMYIDPKIQANINRELIFGRVVVNEEEKVEFRTIINLRGGRNVENILWDILEFSKEALEIKKSLYE